MSLTWSLRQRYNTDMRQNRNYKGRKLPQVLNQQEVEALLKIPNKRAATGLRNRAILGLMVNAGLRVSEVIGKEGEDDLKNCGGLRLDHIDLKTGDLRIVNGKGGVDRNLAMNDEDVEILKKWLKVRPATDHNLVFCTLKGERMENRYLRSMVARIAKKAGIKRRVYPHLLRHTALTDLYSDTKNVLLVQNAAGHRSPNTTQIYVHITADDVKDAMRKLRRRKRAGS